MAERQGKLGDMWNACAVKFLSLFDWNHIGDKDIDVIGEDGNNYGIDALMDYNSPGMATRQSVIVESKRYSKDSINYSVMSGWLRRLMKKLEQCRNSEELQNEFPALMECCSINLGVILVWVHDAENEEYFHSDFTRLLNRLVSVTRAKPNAFKRIIVLTNPQILRLCALYETLKDCDYAFVYPSQLIGNYALERSKVLTIDYMLSNVILTEIKKDGATEKHVFYFGIMTVDAVKILRESLLKYQFAENDKKLVIHYTQHNDRTADLIHEFEKQFTDVSSVSFKRMSKYNLTTEPSIISNEDE